MKATLIAERIKKSITTPYLVAARKALLQTPWRRRAAWAWMGLLAAWALAWMLVPPMLKSQIEKLGTQVLGRSVTVGSVNFKPWTLELTVTDLAVARKDGGGPQLSIARIYVNAELESLLRMAPVIAAAEVKGPTLHIAHLGGGHYDVDDIVERLRTPADAPASAPLRFALYNLVLGQGALELTDRAAGAERKHSVRAIELTLPFLSNLDAQRDVKASPRLAFELDGSKFDSAGDGTPFSETRKGDIHFKVLALNLAPYLGYLPAGLPVQLKAAVLDADVRLNFEQTQPAQLRLSGRIKVSGLQLADALGVQTLGVDSIQTEFADVRPLEKVIRLTSVELVAPRLRVARNRAGKINLIPASASAVSKEGKTADLKPGWTLGLAQLGLHQGEINWTDDSLQSPARLSLGSLELRVKDVRWPFTAPATLEGSATLSTTAKSVGAKSRVVFTGQATAQAGKMHLGLGDVSLGLAAPYLAQHVLPSVAGVLDAELDAVWAASAMQLQAPRISVRSFALSQGQVPGTPARGVGQRGLVGSTASEWPRFKSLEITDARLNLAQRTASVGKVALHDASAMLRRDAQGQWMFEQWLVGAASAADVTTSVPPQAWKLNIGEAQLDGTTLGLDDRSMAKPVRLELTGLRVQAKRLTLDGKKPADLAVSAQIRAGRTEAGSLKYQGSVMWDPVLTQGTLEAIDIPAHAFAPYLVRQLNMELLRADTSFRGQLRYAATATGAQLQVKGDAALEDFRANSGNEELLSWKSLNVPGIVLEMAPGTATRLQVREAALSDFYARVIVHPTGRLNLQDLVKTEQTSTPAGPAPATPEAVVQMGPISLLKGRVLFSDRFIQPNYSADLSELAGKLSQFSSGASGGVVQLADLDVRGRAEGTATLEIVGRLNPLAKPLALDIGARVRDLELPPLSPYAVKYAGYGIERGKLSVDVKYKVESDGQLNASNNIVLNQLAFGDKVEGAPNSLPVKLAAALLADRNGVIDLNLPISGSLGDPQFKLGAVVWKIISNLVVKAITSPFSLLASALGGGGGDELGTVAFAPGSSELREQARLGLDKVATALTERPAMIITVVGMASLDIEREAVKQQLLNTQLLAEKRRQAVLGGKDAAAVQGLDAQEIAGLLRAVYRRADIAKPRNLVGLTKDIAPEEMQALLLFNIPVNEDAVRGLALKRGVAVKDYLATRQLPAERLFLGAPQVVKVSGSAESAWHPHAELSLTQK